jgi:hypothetical protein
MTDIEERIEKLYAQAVGERNVGNHLAAEAFAAKAEELQRKHHLPIAVEATAKPQPESEECICSKYQHGARECRALTHCWEVFPAAAQVVVELLPPGMKRTVLRVLTMDVARPLLKRGSAIFVRDAKSNDIFLRPQEVAPPKEKIWFC